MKLLVPTDFSTCADHALNYAANLGRRTGHDLRLLHVYAPLDLANTAMISYIEQEVEEAQKDIKDKLHRICMTTAEKNNISCSHNVRIGALTENILAEAEESHCKLIVMGTEGASGLNKLLFGSRTSSVIESSDFPVLAVPPQSSIALPKKIVFATNFFDSDLDTLKQLLTLVKGWKPEIYLLHVSHDNLRSERDYIENFSKAVVKETDYKPLYYYVLPHENSERGIELFIKSVGGEMLVLSTRKRSFLERVFNASLTKQIAYHLTVPLLAYHTKLVDN